MADPAKQTGFGAQRRQWDGVSFQTKRQMLEMGLIQPEDLVPTQPVPSEPAAIVPARGGPAPSQQTLDAVKAAQDEKLKQLLKNRPDLKLAPAGGVERR